MMVNFGNLTLLMAFIVCSYGLVTSILGGWKYRPGLIESARRSVLATYALVSIACAVLIALIINNQFNVQYVYSVSNIDLPLFYKITGLWAGHDGSLLFWSWVLLTYASAAVILTRKKFQVMQPWIIMVLLGTTHFFLVLNIFVANPFGEWMQHLPDGTYASFMPMDGRGLNPLLQHPAMVIHPPVLYFGLIGFVVPFAFAFAALMTRQLGIDWIKATRRWTLTSWFFLSCGIMLGGKWAYVELGWGGYWAWDPVENASLMPWLTGTAFLHSVMIQERKGMLKVWNIVLIVATYLLSILGTFLTRSGVVSSVHSFAASSIGWYFLTFIGIAVIALTYLIIIRLPYLRSEHELDSVVSRESAFLFNNLLFVLACLSVLFGTLFPVFSEAATEIANKYFPALSGFFKGRVAVTAPYFNKVEVPIGLLILFLTGAGPLLAWRRTSLEGLKRNFTLPVILSILTAIFCVAMGIRHVYAIISFVLCAFVTVTIIEEFYRGAKTRVKNAGENWLMAVFNLTRKNKRRYCGYIIHFGIVVLFIGFTGKAFTVEQQADLAPGESMTVKHYTLTLESIEHQDTPNYTSDIAKIKVEKDGRTLKILDPEKRFYKASEQPTTEVRIHSTFKEDLYVVFAGMAPGQGERGMIQIWINPLVKFVWVGTLIVAIGTLLAMLPDHKTPVMPRPAKRSRQAEETFKTTV